ncbi:MAG: AbrB/MazE/SpoVT family DNA-binding domain-containing protein [Clostridia bacterium]|nr:AbrB/MazE/SpoVT family DNA-binding domain-containing protein [Clostridia bacterium]
MYNKKIDSLGRVVIPKNILKKMNWQKGETITFFVSEKNHSLIIKKLTPACIDCGEKSDLIFIKDNIYLCKKCLFEIYDRSEKTFD